MLLNVNYQSTTPIYQQLFDGIKKLIETGELKKNESLPSIRKLANQLDISVNTVARAYQELERQGLIETGGRRGTFIKGNVLEGDAKSKFFKKEILNLLKNGFSKNEIRGFFESSFNEIFE